MNNFFLNYGLSRSPRPWNHNVQYHDAVLQAVPPGCQRALDVGCGRGQLARQLACHCQEVIAIDADQDALTSGRAASGSLDRITYLHGDVMTHPFSPGSFDFVAVVAALHHLPLKPALVHFRDLLEPGGVLAVIGLYRTQQLRDYAFAAAAFPVSWTLRCLHGQAEVGAPLQDPKETFREIRAAGEEVLPGAEFKRRLLFRYSLIWRKP